MKLISYPIAESSSEANFENFFKTNFVEKFSEKNFVENFSESSSAETVFETSSKS